MKKQLLLIITILCAIIALHAASAEIQVLTWGYAQPSQGHLVGDNWIIGGEEYVCSSDWNCTSFAACGVNYRKECLGVTDLNSCGAAFDGDLDDYEANCDWCDENPDLEVCSRERNNMYMLIWIPLMLGLFALVGAATLGKEHGAFKIALFMLSFVSTISATYIGSNIVSTTDSQVQTALGVTTNWMTWVFIVVVLYFLIYLIHKIFDTIGRNREQKLDY